VPRLAVGTLASALIAALALGLQTAYVPVKFTGALQWTALSLVALFEALLAVDAARADVTVVDRRQVAKAASAAGAAGAAAAAAPLDPLVLARGLGVAKDYAVDVYLAFIAWSILTSLATLIWFFPLFGMGLSGEESAIASTLAPILLAVGPYRRFVQRTQVRAEAKRALGWVYVCGRARAHTERAAPASPPHHFGRRPRRCTSSRR